MIWNALFLSRLMVAVTENLGNCSPIESKGISLKLNGFMGG
jgi:hypothetical protein